MIQHSEYGSMHVQYNNDAKHYEYLGRERREEIVTGKAKEIKGDRGDMRGDEGRKGSEAGDGGQENQNGRGTGIQDRTN
eukprot:4289173-Pleurochrysis_carterae.AAC.1